MDQNERKKLEEGLELFLDEGLERLLLSHPTEPSGCSRSRIRPPLFKGGAGISGRGTDRKTGLSPKPDERRGGRLCLPDA